MKKIFTLLLVGLISISLMLTGCTKKQDPTQNKTDTAAAPAAVQEPTDLNFVLEYNDRHPAYVNAFQPWTNAIEDKSGGKIKFTIYPPGTLVPHKDVYSATVVGNNDVLGTSSSNIAEKIPAFDLFSLPLIVTGSEQGSLLITKMAEKYPERFVEVFDDTQPLMNWTGSVFQIHTKKPVKTLADLKGMKIITMNAPSSEQIKLLGGSPVTVMISDVYTALQRGVADGIMMPFAPIKSLKITEICKNHTVMNLSSAAFFLTMNKDKFNKLTPEMQKFFEDSAGVKLSQAVGQAIVKSENADIQWMKDQGDQVFVLSDADMAKIKEVLTPIYDEWVKQMEGKGITNARQMLNDAMTMGAEITKQLAAAK